MNAPFAQPHSARHGLRRLPAGAAIATALLAGATLLSPSAACAQQKVDTAQSDIAFTSRQMGVPVDGKFKKWDAQISFDPKKPEATKVAFSIQTGSVAFGAAETDAEVVKAPWFNVAKFPVASFQSSGVKANGPGKLQVSGTLSIKGQSQAVVIPVVLTQAGAATTASGSFAIKRLDFQIGEGEWADTSIVANDVLVRFKLAVSGVAPL